MLSSWNIYFNVFNLRTDAEFLFNFRMIVESVCKRPVLTSDFDVSKLQKQLGSVTQFYLDQSANFGPSPLNVCVTLSDNVAFNGINP